MVSKNILEVIIINDRYDTENGLKLKSQTLIAEKDQLYLLDFDGSIIGVDSYCAIGSDEDLLLGMLEATEKLKPEDRIKRIFDAYSKVKNKRAIDRIVMDTKNLEIRRI